MFSGGRERVHWEQMGQTTGLVNLLMLDRVVFLLNEKLKII